MNLNPKSGNLKISSQLDEGELGRIFKFADQYREKESVNRGRFERGMGGAGPPPPKRKGAK
jgi:hypothetical protein